MKYSFAWFESELRGSQASRNVVMQGLPRQRTPLVEATIRHPLAFDVNEP